MKKWPKLSIGDMIVPLNSKNIDSYICIEVKGDRTLELCLVVAGYIQFTNFTNGYNNSHFKEINS